MEKVGLNSVDLGYYYKRHGKAMVAKFRQDIITEGYIWKTIARHSTVVHSEHI